jgi:lysophospholipid acyltransferase (LPLAT)-like uncharacterized protein
VKIRNRHLVWAAGYLGAAVARGLVRSLSLRLHFIGSDVGDRRLEHSDRFIYCVWHDSLLLPVARFGGPDLAALISSHADGQILGGLIKAMGMEMVLGSTTRGGVEAIRQLTRAEGPRRNLAVTPDGPRGPRRVIQQGIIYIASRTGMKIVPVGVGYRNPWKLRSWDRFAVPKPFSRACCIAGEPMSVPPNLRGTGFEDHRRIVQFEMDRVNAAAEEWASTNKLHIPPMASPQSIRRAS